MAFGDRLGYFIGKFPVKLQRAVKLIYPKNMTLAYAAARSLRNVYLSTVQDEPISITASGLYLSLKSLKSKTANDASKSKSIQYSDKDLLHVMDIRKVICRRCQMSDHMAADCPSPYP